MENIIAEHATDRKKDGSEAKAYTHYRHARPLDILRGIYQRTMPSRSAIKTKMANQLEILGYIDLTTGKEEDRSKLVLTDVVPLRAKRQRDVGLRLFTKSIGSGKMRQTDAQIRLYKKDPLKKLDVICADRIAKNKSGYWYLLE